MKNVFFTKDAFVFSKCAISFIILSFLSLFNPALSAQQNRHTNQKEHTNLTDTVISLDEVVVSKKRLPAMMKLSVPIHHLPISVNTLHKKTLEVRGITEIQQASRLLPGVKIGSGMFKSIRIRGFSGAPILVDGIRDERLQVGSPTITDLSSMESIELLKGPASVLSGSSAVGGLINIVRKAPQATPIARAMFSYGSWNRRQSSFDFGGKLSGPINYRTNINYTDGDGWRNDGNKRASIFLALSSAIGDKGSLIVRGGAYRDEYGNDFGLPALMRNDIFNLDGTAHLKYGEMQPGLDQSARYDSPSDFLYNKNLNLSAHYKHQFSERLRLSNYISFSDDNIDYLGTESMNYPTSKEPIYNHYFIKDKKKTYINLDSLIRNRPLCFQHLAKTINEQAELSGQIKTGSLLNNFLFGYSFIQMRRNTFQARLNQGGIFGPGLNSMVAVYNPQRDMGYWDTRFTRVTLTQHTTHSLYLHDLIEFSPQLKVMLAGRYDLYSYKSAVVPTPSGKKEYVSPGKSDFNGNNTSAFTYRVGMVYLPHPDISIYGSIASFFKPYRDHFSENNIYINADGNEFFPQKGKEIFKPENGFQTELGTRYTLNNKLQVTGSLFYIKMQNVKKNLKTFDIEENGATVAKNVVGQVGVMDSKGFDIEVIYDPRKNISLTAGYSYTDARTRELKPNKYMEHEANNGLRFNGIPANTFYAYGSYAIPNGLFKNVAFNITTSYMDKVYMDIQSELYYPSYWLTDLGATYTLPKNGLTFVLNVNNVFDKTYYERSWSRQLSPSMPRNVRISIQYQL